jgi:predicted extracellular nuclease
VVGDFQDTPTTTNLDGFFVQEEDGDVDNDPMTSEGIFVYDASFGVDISVGDLVRVQGDVDESYGLTELNNISSVEVHGSGMTVTLTAVDLPVAAIDDLERFEGMWVTFPEMLYATETYDLGRYGEVWVSAEGRLYNPTHITTPGESALALQDLNDRSRLLVDDGSRIQNPETVPYLAPDNTLRLGDTVTDLTGVLSYGNDYYRLQPTLEPAFTRQNQRSTAPDDIGGTFKVASFNVLNYFNGDGQGGGFPTSRGADTLEEFNRQRAKIVTATLTIDADVIGLMEIENDGYGPYSAIQDLVNGLNDATSPGTYAFIDPGVSQIGTDEIAVGIIYKSGTATPVGEPAILDSSVDPRFIDTKNRPVLAQTFQDNGTGELLTVAVNHLKSKGSSCDDVGDPDLGDGQGNCNLTRTSAAIALADWLATDPTGSGDPDSLIIGDLNSYAMEDPITALRNAGYSDLVDTFLGPDAYSYVFVGQAGYLDHALASVSLAPQVVGTTIWHINADEPCVLDYNQEYNPPYVYAPDPFRASDHDPVMITFWSEPAYLIYLPIVQRGP